MDFLINTFVDHMQSTDVKSTGAANDATSSSTNKLDAEAVESKKRIQQAYKRCIEEVGFVGEEKNREREN